MQPVEPSDQPGRPVHSQTQRTPSSWFRPCCEAPGRLFHDRSSVAVAEQLAQSPWRARRAAPAAGPGAAGQPGLLRVLRAVPGGAARGAARRRGRGLRLAPGPPLPRGAALRPRVRPGAAARARGGAAAAGRCGARRRADRACRPLAGCAQRAPARVSGADVQRVQGGSPARCLSLPETVARPVTATAPPVRQCSARRPGTGAS